MRITWNVLEKSFDAEFTPGDQWKLDQQAVKAAGFKCTGPDKWQWYTQKIEVLLKLKASGTDISISPEALAVFRERKILADKAAEVVKAFETAKALERGTLTPDQKAERKADIEKKRAERDAKLIAAGKAPKEKKERQAKGGDVKSYTIDFSKIAELVASFPRYKPPPPPDLRCIYCADPVYLYELCHPVPVCLWCEKLYDKTVDNANTNVVISQVCGEREIIHGPGDRQ